MVIDLTALEPQHKRVFLQRKPFTNRFRCLIELTGKQQAAEIIENETGTSTDVHSFSHLKTFNTTFSVLKPSRAFFPAFFTSEQISSTNCVVLEGQGVKMRFQKSARI